MLEEEKREIPIELKTYMKWEDSGMLPLGFKINIAMKLCEYNEILLNDRIIHGDLHWKNIMVTKLSRKKCDGTEEFSCNLKIIDFGTSLFTNETIGLDRNFNTLIETINRCIYPFKLEDINASQKPKEYKDFPMWIKPKSMRLGQDFMNWNRSMLDGHYIMHLEPMN